jgi:hypothetical protein
METPESDRIELVKGIVPSLLLNLGFLLIAKGDQRILLLLFASTIIGLVLLLTPRGALGFGILLGAIAAAVIALALAGFAHWSPLS